MKTLLMVGTLLLYPDLSVIAQRSIAVAGMVNYACAITEKPADAILGEWLDDKGTVQIQVYKADNKYHARIVWLKDATIASNGTKVLEGLQYKQNNTWQQGRIFYPRTNSWYDCRCTLHDSSLMKVRAYLGTPFLGKTLNFIRVKHP